MAGLYTAKYLAEKLAKIAKDKGLKKCSLKGIIGMDLNKWYVNGYMDEPLFNALRQEFDKAGIVFEDDFNPSPTTYLPSKRFDEAIDGVELATRIRNLSDYGVVYTEDLADLAEQTGEDIDNLIDIATDLGFKTISYQAENADEDMDRLAGISTKVEQPVVEEEINESNEVREYINKIIDFLDQDMIDPKWLAEALMDYISEDEVANFAHYNDYFDVDEIESTQNVRKATIYFHDLFEEGALDATEVAKNLLHYISEDTAKEFYQSEVDDSEDYIEDDFIQDDEEILDEENISIDNLKLLKGEEIGSYILVNGDNRIEFDSEGELNDYLRFELEMSEEQITDLKSEIK